MHEHEFIVTGTIREPDGRVGGAIVGLVIREKGLLIILTTKDVAARLRTERFWALTGEGRGKQPVTVGPGSDSDGQPVPWCESEPPGRNGLADLPIWDRGRACWVNPLRPGGPPLSGPGQ